MSRKPLIGLNLTRLRMLHRIILLQRLVQKLALIQGGILRLGLARHDLLIDVPLRRLLSLADFTRIILHLVL